MHRLNELVLQLTPAHLKEVEDFAEFLASRQKAEPTGIRPDVPNGVRFDGWAGCLADVHPEMSDAEFGRMMLDERLRKAME